MDDTNLEFLIKYPKPILEKLMSNDIISDELYQEYKEVFDFFSIKKKSKFNSYSVYSLPGYFAVSVVIGYKQDRDETIIPEMIKKFDAKGSANSLFFHHIKLERLEEFILEYINDNSIQWHIILAEPNIKWNIKFIEFILNSSDNPGKWGFLFSTININWSIEFITKYNSLWNWKSLHQNPSVKWNFELIEANKDFINWDYLGEYSELNWNSFYLNNYKEYFKFSKRFHDSLCFSESKFIKGDENLIECVRDYWDWKILCANKHIKWDFNLIERFADKIDFEILSENKSVVWDEHLIDNHLEKWDWKLLSYNPSLPWSESFIDKYKSKWKWKKKYSWTDGEGADYDEPSLSANSGIKWDVSLLTKYENKVDFWLIALKGSIDDEAIIKFHQYFNKKEHVGYKYHRDSDGYIDEELYRTGWENFILNPHFSITRRNLIFYYHYYISITRGKIISSNLEYVISEHPLLKIFWKSPISGINFKDVMANENCWANCLIDVWEINESVWKDLIKPLFKNKFIMDFLHLLSKKYV
ncbi:MAG: hypothetical protein ABI723_22985 [Bacteroidia bacterium]